MDNNSIEEKKEIKKETKHCIAEELDSFRLNLESLEISAPIILDALGVFANKCAKNFDDFLKTNGKVVEQEKNSITYSLSQNILPEVKKQDKRLKTLITGGEIISKQIILSMVSQYDFFIGKILKCIYYLKPELLNLLKKSITFSELMLFQNIDIAKESIIEKEVDSFLRDSHLEQINKLEDVTNLKLTSDRKLLANFIELTERRNLFAHTNGIVSSQYISNCCKYGTVPKDVKLGSILSVDKEYLDNAFECLYEIAVKISHIIWQKIDTKEIEKCFNNLINISFELLQNNKYNLVIRILDFFTKDEFKNKCSDNVRRYLIINLAQAYKWSGNSDMCQKTLSSIDWSATGDIFQLALSTLNDNIDKVCKFMKKDIENIDKNAYRIWPLFRNMRKEQQFQDTFKEKFLEDLLIIKTDKDVNNRDVLNKKDSEKEN